MTSRARSVLHVLAVAVISGLVAMNILWMSGSSDEPLAVVITGVFAALITAVGYYFYRTDRERQERILLTHAAQIEELARQAVVAAPETRIEPGGDQAAPSLATALRERGIWSRDDVASHRVVLRARDAIVHGRHSELNNRQLEDAIQRGGHLVERIKAARPDDRLPDPPEGRI
jgi:hypothetical protein